MRDEAAMLWALRVVVLVAAGLTLGWFGGQLCLGADVLLGAGHVHHESECRIGGGAVGALSGLMLAWRIVRPQSNDGGGRP